MLPTLLRILFPDFCSSCGAYGEVLCTNCIDNCKPNTRTLTHGIFASLSYKDPQVKRLLKLMKSRPLPTIANQLGQRLADDSTELLCELASMKNFGNPLVVPIPQTAARAAERGYNHAELLASAFTHHRPIPSARLRTDILLKTKSTHKQALATARAARFENIRGSFSVAQPELVADQCVIVVDDITTTGATLLAARDALQQAGARIVVCLAVAH